MRNAQHRVWQPQRPSLYLAFGRLCCAGFLSVATLLCWRLFLPRETPHSRTCDASDPIILLLRYLRPRSLPGAPAVLPQVRPDTADSAAGPPVGLHWVLPVGSPSDDWRGAGTRGLGICAPVASCSPVAGCAEAGGRGSSHRGDLLTGRLCRTLFLSRVLSAGVLPRSSSLGGDNISAAGKAHVPSLFLVASVGLLWYEQCCSVRKSASHCCPLEWHLCPVGTRSRWGKCSEFWQTTEGTLHPKAQMFKANRADGTRNHAMWLLATVLWALRRTSASAGSWLGRWRVSGTLPPMEWVGHCHAETRWCAPRVVRGVSGASGGARWRLPTWSSCVCSNAGSHCFNWDHKLYLDISHSPRFQPLISAHLPSGQRTFSSQIFPDCAFCPRWFAEGWVFLQEALPDCSLALTHTCASSASDSLSWWSASEYLLINM